MIHRHVWLSTRLQKRDNIACDETPDPAELANRLPGYMSSCGGGLFFGERYRVGEKLCAAALFRAALDFLVLAQWKYFQ